MKKLIVFILLMLISVPVYAETFYYDNERVEEMWITKINDKETRSAHPYLIKRRSDNSYIFCLEPFTMLENDVKYIEDDDYEKYGLTKEQIERINLIINYGYGYKQHTSNIWYGVTQYLIWKEADKKADIYFTDKQNGAKKDLYRDEISEIEKLIKEHNTEPNFLKDYNISINQELLIDSNINLDNFKIESKLDFKLENNKLILSASKPGKYLVKLIRKENRFKTKFALYYSSISQNIIVPGYSENYYQEYLFNVNVLEGKIIIDKKNRLNEEKLCGAIYGIYKDNQLIKKITTNEQGQAEVSLELGNYVIKEIEAPTGYNLDTKEYSVILDEKNLEASLKLYNDKIIIKVPDTYSINYSKRYSLVLLIIGISLLYVKK